MNRTCWPPFINSYSCISMEFVEPSMTLNTEYFLLYAYMSFHVLWHPVKFLDWCISVQDGCHHFQTFLLCKNWAWQAQQKMVLEINSYHLVHQTCWKLSFCRPLLLHWWMEISECGTSKGRWIGAFCNRVFLNYSLYHANFLGCFLFCFCFTEPSLLSF